MADGGNIPQVARIVCPYFVRLTNERRAIVCEGTANGTKTAVMFKTRRDMELYSEKMCETYRFNRCMVARMLAEKYMDKD